MSIKDTNFITIQGWMINKLGLECIKQITIYAIIYGFTQDGESKFTGNQKYLSGFIKTSTKTVSRILHELCNRKLIIQTEIMINNVTFYHYHTNLAFNSDMSTGQTNCLGGVDKLSRGGGQIVSGGVDKLSTYNIEDNIYNKKDNIKDGEAAILPPTEPIKKKEHAIDFNDLALKAKLEQLPPIVSRVLLEEWLPYKVQKHEQIKGKHMRNLYVHKGFSALVSGLLNDIKEGKNPALAIVHSMRKSWEGIFYPTNSNDVLSAKSRLDSLERTDADKGLF